MSNEKRAIDGIVLVNKPQGLTSNAVLQRVKRLFRAKKAGHTGSLDPLATGMLPICLGEATKVCHYLLDADKCYDVCGELGVTTDTGDAMGKVLTRVEGVFISQDILNMALLPFSGAIKQTPPMYSALKHQGKPLYHYARKGVTLERAPRDVRIDELQCVAFDGVRMNLHVVCSKGTYIRSLVESIGDELGCGAHVTILHRCYTAGFEDDVMFTLDELEAMDEAHLLGTLLPMTRALNHFPSVTLSIDQLHALRQGRVLQDSLHFAQQGCVQLHTEHQQFVGLGEIQADGILITKRLLAFENTP
jgi:tRNA pseudouridine55 synthase